MSTESLVERLTRALQDAQETLRAQFAVKITQVAPHLENASAADVREVLDQLTDDLIAEFANAYQELIAQVEEGLPAGAPAHKATTPRKKAPPKDPATEPVFVRPTYVQKAFSADGLRVAKAARPALMEVLNDAIREDIARIKDQLPTVTKGEREGEKRRVTVQPEDIAKLKLQPKPDPATLPAPAAGSGPEQDLGTISLGDDAPGHQIAVVLRPKKG
jgi:hypothetical protein